ncbi:hypothetical protein CVT24_010665 [Panaeolus cyanescens]|uniref:Uncharacterized protein n=1 Tax=Panaeolus cyanescens TaxID=181874 RepID=A0A409YM41_9AGAR|nr:hypothetical protein CVT24_010665 [Panaeolus cyanescens]
MAVWALVVIASWPYLLEAVRSLISRYIARVTPNAALEFDVSHTYTDLDDWESSLPQHNLHLPFPEGAFGRFVFFSNSRELILGWNNKLNLISNRTYVFSDFLWPEEHYPWREPRYRAARPRTPLNALMSGPSAGGSWAFGDPAPRAISQRWFDIVCPVSDRKLVYADEIKRGMHQASGDVIFSHWQKLLSETPERCIEVTTKSKGDPNPEVFDASLWGTTRSLSLWDEFKESPVSRLLATSPLVESAIEENLALFVTRSIDRLFRLIDGRQPDQHRIFERVMTIHVRRGDFQGACIENWERRATFYNWNLLPFLPDRLTLPSNGSWATGSEQKKEYLERCFAEIATIVKKVRRAKLDYLLHSQHRTSAQSLDALYIMSNDRTEWVHELKEALRRDGWSKVIMSQDLKLNAAQKEVGVAVDMDIGRRSAVYLGNGKIFHAFPLTPSASTTEELPPDFTVLREWEAHLPQHNVELSYPEGRSGRYVLFSNSRVNLLGWNNKLNELLLNSWLAYESNRSYVFHDFAWKDHHYPWPIQRFNEWMPRTPLNALMSGPSAGAAWETGDKAPRAVHENYFNRVCPKSERRIINTHQVKPAIYWEDGRVIFSTWKKLLNEVPERCVEVVPASREQDIWPETFDILFWSGSRGLSLWNDFIASPISRLLRPSGVVESAIDTNKALFLSRKRRSQVVPLENALDTVLAIHVRRGDFKEACLEHAAMNSTFYSWNLLPFLPDKFTPPPGPTPTEFGSGGSASISSDTEALYLSRCLPGPVSIANKVKQAKEEYTRYFLQHRPGQQQERRPLDVLYIMSNDNTQWIDDLKATLKRDGWGQIVTSRDLRLTQEQKEVSVAVDMDIGRRAAVFIGNGVSSSSGNFAVSTHFMTDYGHAFAAFSSGRLLQVMLFTEDLWMESHRSAFGSGDFFTNVFPIRGVVSANEMYKLSRDYDDTTYV